MTTATATLKLTDKAASLSVHLYPDMVTGDEFCAVLEDARGGLQGYWVRADPTAVSDGIRFRKDDNTATYRVTLVCGRAVKCTCPDHAYRARTCKHMASAKVISAETF